MPAPLATIIAATDFSDASSDAWQTACALARLAGSRLHLVHVCADPLRQPWTVEAVGVDFTALSAEWQREAEQRLAEFQPTEAIPPSSITRAVLVGTPHQAIVAYAAQVQADLIVLGTHGYGPIKHLLLGSVADRVIRHARCPVLTVPHHSLRVAPPVEARETVTAP